MPIVYFAKFNINEKIYDVYDNKISLSNLQDTIYQSLSTEIELSEEVKNKITNFKFITLDKNPETMIINGRLVAYAPGTHISYDPEKDNVVETADNKKATYITFSFDIKKEIIGFVTKFDFGRNQFLERFKLLTEASASNVGEVELFLESDKQKLKDKLRNFQHVQEVAINLVPPNNDRRLFKKLFDLDSEKLNDTGGTKFYLSIKGTAKKGIDLASSYMRNMVNGITIGYGNLIAIGENRMGEELRVKSDKDALFTKNISESNKDSIPEIAEKTKAGTNTLMALKNKVKDDYEAEDLKEDLMKELVEKDDRGDESKE